MQKLAKMGDVGQLKRTAAVDTLTSLLEDFSSDPIVLLHVLRALKEVADIDSDFNAKLARQIGRVLMVRKKRIMNRISGPFTVQCEVV